MHIYRETRTHAHTLYVLGGGGCVFCVDVQTYTLMHIHIGGGRGGFCVDVQTYTLMHIHIGGGRGVFGVERRGGWVGR
jgi:hypothetical protein